MLHYCQKLVKTSYKRNDKYYTWKESRTIRKFSLSKNISKCCKMSTECNVWESWYHLRADIFTLYMDKIQFWCGAHVCKETCFITFSPQNLFFKKQLYWDMIHIPSSSPTYSIQSHWVLIYYIMGLLKIMIKSIYNMKLAVLTILGA